MKPDCLDDLIALVALYRPGPMDNIPRYNNCKHGRERPDYLHPDLEEILRETFGVIIYQEQVMQIAQKLSGFSLARADLLRRAMGKKIQAEMDAQRDAFVDGAVARGVDEAKAKQIFEQVDKFAGYGFNKSHAAAYALIAYQTAWLKANHPVEFFAALMTMDLGNTDKLGIIRQELQRLDFALLPPDVNRSEATFSVETVGNGNERKAIRYALAAIRKVGEQAMADLAAEREAGGPFKDEFDFAQRLGGVLANRQQLESLVRAGALDSLNPNRRRVFESIDHLVRLGQAAAQAQDSNQTNLFGDDGHGLPPVDRRRPEVDDWTAMERLDHEFDAVGFYLSAHPLDAYERRLKRLGVAPYGEVARSGRAGTCKLAGIVAARQERTSSKGSRFAYVGLTDSSGSFEVVVFSDLLAQSRDLLEANSRVLVTAESRVDGDGVRLIAQRIESLDRMIDGLETGLIVRVQDPTCLETLKSEIGSWKPGRGRVSLLIGVESEREVEVKLPNGYSVPAESLPALGALAGVSEVTEI